VAYPKRLGATAADNGTYRSFGADPATSLIGRPFRSQMTDWIAGLADKRR